MNTLYQTYPTQASRCRNLGHCIEYANGVYITWSHCCYVVRGGGYPPLYTRLLRDARRIAAMRAKTPAVFPID